MNTRFATLVLAFVCLAAGGLAADKSEPKQASPEEIKARLAEHARKKAAEAEAARAAAAKKETDTAAVAAPVATGADAKPAAPADAKDPKAAADTKQEAPTVLPKVEVKKGKITELDRQLEKQNQEIAREKKNAKPTPLDDTLNGSKVSKVFALFGGQSSDDRANVAKERVAMMEEERDLIEAIAQAQTKEEKAELQKTLDDMRAMRRELEQSLR